MTRTIQAPCPNCDKSLSIPAEWLGRAVRCKHCGMSSTFGSAPAKKAPAPIVEPLNSAESLPEITPAIAVSAAPSRPVSYRPRRSSGAGMWILGAALIAATAGIGVLVAKPEIFFKKGKADSGSETAREPGKENVAKTDGGASDLAVPAGIFPRRLMVVNVVNYVFANPIHGGDGPVRRETDRRDTSYVANRMAERWKIPKDQVFELTDSPGQTLLLAPEPKKEKGPAAKGKGKGKGKGEEEPKPVPAAVPVPPTHSGPLPLRNIITQSIAEYLKTCRDQDRIVLLFCGHAAEKDGAVFLAPLEGEFDDTASMIPLAEVYAMLAKCPAQEKIAVFDVCRKNSKRGEERPIFGPMTEPMEKAFHTPPQGVTVWTACSANQYSYELNAESYGSDGGTFVNGSIFLNLFLTADVKGKLSVRENKKAGGIQTPDDPLPFTALEEYVREQAKIAAQAMEGQPQVPKLTRSPKVKEVAYNPAEASPPRFAWPTPSASASGKDIALIFAEMELPPIKGGTASTAGFNVIPFAADALKAYLPDGSDADNKDPMKFPIRAAVLDAVKEIRLLYMNQTKALPTDLRENINDNLKKRLTETQRPLADAQALFETLSKKFKKLAERKADEPSKRWQAHFDTLHAQIQLRLAYFGEYNKALAAVKTDSLDASQSSNGFILASVEKMSASKDVRDFAEEGKALLEQMAKDYAGTPWGVLAKRDRFLSLGLKWMPVKLAGDAEKDKDKDK